MNDSFRPMASSLSHCSLLALLFLIFFLLPDTVLQVNSVSQYFESGGYCKHRFDCICGKKGQGTRVHCEGIIDIARNLRGSNQQIEIRCLANVTSAYFFDNLSLLEMDTNSPQETHLTIEGCLLPKLAISSLFNTGKEGIRASGTTALMIEGLTINCGHSQGFVLERNHLEGMRFLQSLEINCPTLTELPRDLLGGVSGNLTSLIISNTSMRSIPRLFISKFTQLTSFVLDNSELSGLPNDFFHGLGEIIKLSLEHNALGDLDDDLLLPVERLEYLKLKNNRLSKLPKSLGVLTSLKVLDASNNQIEYIEPGCLSNLRSLSRFQVSNNIIKVLDLHLLQGMRMVKYIFLTNNDIGETLPSNSFGIVFSGLNNSGNRLDPSNITSYSLPEGLFSNNPLLKWLYLRKNSLTSVPERIFFENPRLNIIDLSSNKLTYLPPNLFERNPELETLDLGNNRLITIPEVLINSKSLLFLLNLSKNKITSLEERFFSGTDELTIVDLNDNLIDSLPVNLFEPFQESMFLETLDLSGNMLSNLPILTLPSVTTLNIARNKLAALKENEFKFMTSLEHLNISYNLLSELDFKLPISMNFKTMDLSHNLLSLSPSIYYEMITKSSAMQLLDLSYNIVSSIYNVIYDVKSESQPLLIHGALTHLNLSKNKLSFKESNWRIDYVKGTWGYVSIISGIFSLEVLLLDHNEIEFIPMDWRHGLPNLSHLDLSHNRIKFLGHQDMIFSNGITEDAFLSLGYSEKRFIKKKAASGTCYYQFSNSHQLTVDLRHNRIAGLELSRHLVKEVPRGCSRDQQFGHSTMLLGGNPFVCGCQVLQLVRYASKELRPVSELELKDGSRLVMPATVNIDNLACWEPISVRGKNISEPDIWMHHLLVEIGLCQLFT